MYFMDFNEVVATVNRQDFEWALEQRYAKGYAEGFAEGYAEGLAIVEAEDEKQVVTTMIRAMSKLGKSRQEIIPFIVQMAELSPESAEQYYNMYLAESEKTN